MKTPALALALLIAVALTACTKDEPTTAAPGAPAPKLGDKTAAAAAAKPAPNAQPYPLKVCVVSGEALDSMGKPHVFTYEGQEVKLCCDGCLKDFKKEPAKFLKKLADARLQPQK